MNLIEEVSVNINELDAAGAPQPVFWTSPQVFDAINQAVLDIYTDIRYAFGTATITTSGPIIEWPTATLMIPQYCVYQGIKLFITTYDMLQDWQNNWPNETQAQPHWILPWDASHFRMWPPPNQSYEMLLYGVPWPPLINDANPDITTLDPLLRQAIVSRATAYLLEETQPLLADAQMADALDNEKRYWRTVRNRQGANVDRLRPGTGWVNAQNGDIGIGRKYT